jgi:hypothetical protein
VDSQGGSCPSIREIGCILNPRHPKLHGTEALPLNYGQSNIKGFKWANGRRSFKMLEPFFFALGLVNNVLLILIFLVRKNHLDLLQRIGWSYFLLAIPAIYAIFLVQKEKKTPRYTIFLVIFLAFLAIEFLYDWLLKIPFRETMDWRLLVPYVALYVSMNYGFVVMTWKYYSSKAGIIVLGLFIVQIIANISTHP